MQECNASHKGDGERRRSQFFGKDDGIAHQGLQEVWGDCNKCAQCEEEIMAEQKRRETREREMNLQMDAMQVYYGETDESG